MGHRANKRRALPGDAAAVARVHVDSFAELRCCSLAERGCYNAENSSAE